jgi:predicted MFS family arabinose efflux permease
LLRRSSNPEDRPALFAAQFALSHAAWLLFYPLAGWLGSRYGIAVAFGVLGCAAALAIGLALKVWPDVDPEAIEHQHSNLPAGHPHATGSPSRQGIRHSHPFVVDDHHPHWPREGG